MPPPNRPHLTFFDDVVVKTGPAVALRTEAAKTRSAFAIAERSGLFLVPNVIEFDDVQGRLVLERIPGVSVHRTMKSIAFGPCRLAFVDRIAKVLAIVHQELRIAPQHLVPLEGTVAWPNEPVVIHGDLSLHNVSLIDTGELAVFDWQTTKLYGGRATFGTYFFDVAWFMMNLFFIRIHGFRYSVSLPVTRLAQHFATSYFESSGRSRDGFEQYLRRSLSETFRVLRGTTTGRQRFYLECVIPFGRRFVSRSTQTS